MYPILFAPDAELVDQNGDLTDLFYTNGLGALSDAISATVEEERNGKFELMIKYPFDGIHFKEVQHSSIIKAKPHDNGAPQLFRVYKITSPMNRQCTIYAEHISYQLNYIPLMPFRAYDIQTALQGIYTHMAEECPFTFWTDIQSAAVYEQTEPEMVRTRLGGQEGSFLDTYGGEFEWDNYTVKLYQQRGMDRDVTLRYGKNITDISQEENISSTYTGVCPYWIGDIIDDDAKAKLEEIIDNLEASIATLTTEIASKEDMVANAKTAYNNAVTKYGKQSSQAKKKKKKWTTLKKELATLKEGKTDAEAELSQREEELRSVEGTKFETMVSLPEQVIYVDEADNFPFHRIRTLDLSDKFEEKPTVAELRDMAEAWMDANCVGEPDISLKVSFVALWDTDEYKDIAPLESVQLCDTVVIEFERLGIRVAAKVTEYKYDVILERYDSIQLGDAKRTLAKATIDNHNLTLDVIEQMPTSSTLQAEIDRATKLINGGYGGYVVFSGNANGQPEEILIMDAPNPANATNVIRMNKNGIGFSTSGYAGPYRTAWTIDSHFVADFITAGTLNANLIHAGILTDYNSVSWAVTADTTVKSGKGYYTRWNDGTAQSPKWVYQLVSNPTGNPHALGYYECSHSGNANFWNLTTGEFQLMSTVKVDNSTLSGYVSGAASSAAASEISAYDKRLNQEAVFNKLTQNGTKQGIIMDSNGNLYINASYIQSGTVVGQSLKFTTNNTSAYTNYGIWFDYGQFRVTLGGTVCGYLEPSYSAVDGFAMRVVGSDLLELSASNEIILGYTGTEVYSQAILNTTLSSTGSDVRIGSAGRLGLSGSTRKIKHDIEPLTDPEIEAKKLYDLRVVQFKYNEDISDPEDRNYQKNVPGLIAEEVAEAYPVATVYYDDEIRDWDHRYILPPMLKLIQEQHEEIEALKSEVAELKAQMQQILTKIGE